MPSMLPDSRYMLSDSVEHLRSGALAAYRVISDGNRAVYPRPRCSDESCPWMPGVCGQTAATQRHPTVLPVDAQSMRRCQQRPCVPVVLPSWLMYCMVESSQSVVLPSLGLWPVSWYNWVMVRLTAVSKAWIRDEMRRRRAVLGDSEAAAASERVVARLRSLEALSGHGPVAAYRSVKGEVSLDALTDGEHWAEFTFPRVRGRDLEFVARYGGQAFLPGSFGIPEPIDGRVLDLSEHRAVLVPLTAFDGCCHRVGQGGGFYDRALAAVMGYPAVRLPARRRPVAIGVAYGFQQIDEVPVDPWDVQLDAVVTDAGLIVADGPGTAGVAAAGGG